MIADTFQSMMKSGWGVVLFFAVAIAVERLSGLRIEALSTIVIAVVGGFMAVLATVAAVNCGDYVGPRRTMKCVAVGSLVLAVLAAFAWRWLLVEHRFWVAG